MSNIKNVTVVGTGVIGAGWIIRCLAHNKKVAAYDKDLKFFMNLKYFVIDCLRINKHPSHYNLNEVIELTKIIKPKKTILTNLHADLDYNYLLNILPKNIIPAYDGMSFNI